MSAASLSLRDVHLPPAPGWWPPAPGWCVLAAVLLALLLAGLWFCLQRWQRRRRWQQLFDVTLAAAASPVARLAVASELLRRAARRVGDDALHLQGEQWLGFLDGRRGHGFREGDGRLLLDGGFRPEVDEAAAARACQLARARFLELMAGRR